MRALIAALFLIAVLPGIARGEDAEDRLYARIQQGKNDIAAAPSLDRKFEALGALRKALDGTSRSPGTREPATRRRVIATSVAMSVYLEKLDETRIREDRCDEIRDEIYLNIDPRRVKPLYLPGEAREALQILDSICVKSRK
jgi:hypothetical protein